jgi:hypothetical protein
MVTPNFLKKLGLDPEKLATLPQALLRKDEHDDLSKTGPTQPAHIEHVEATSSLSKILTGAPSHISEAYFPPNVIGGSCPRVVGEEEQIVWNAAAEACDSERIHVVWQVADEKIWFLAVHSSDLSSHPNSWCPFAALLPGMKNAQPSPVCYTYYGDEIATMMTITSDGLQIYRGTNLIVRAKAERTAREHGNAPMIELIPDRISTLTPVPWYSLSLFEDQARRILAAVAMVFSIGITLVAFLVWMAASLALITARHNLEDALLRTEDKTLQLMADAQKIRSSPMRDQIAAFTDLNDGLLDLNGFLEVYDIKAGKARWRALVPSNVTADRINALGGKTIETKTQGTVIGNAAELEYEAGLGAKK